MAKAVLDHSDLDPAELRHSLVLPDRSGLRPSITTDLYSGTGTPTAGNELKPSVVDSSGNLKPSWVDANGLKSSVKKWAGSKAGGSSWSPQIMSSSLNYGLLSALPLDGTLSSLIGHAGALNGAANGTSTEGAYTGMQVTEDGNQGVKVDGRAHLPRSSTSPFSGCVIWRPDSLPSTLGGTEQIPIFQNYRTNLSDQRRLNFWHHGTSNEDKVTILASPDGTSTGLVNEVGITDVVAGTVYVLYWQYDGTNLTWWLNNVQQGQHAMASVHVPTTDIPDATYGVGYAGATLRDDNHATFFGACHWNRVLTSSERGSLSIATVRALVACNPAYVLWGQSNISGEDSLTLPAGYTGAATGSKIWNISGNTWDDLNATVNTAQLDTGTRWGPSTVLAWWHKNAGRTPYLFEYSKTGAPLSDESGRDDWGPTSGELRPSMLAELPTAMEAAEDDAGTPLDLYIIQGQGEADANTSDSPAQANAYEDEQAAIWNAISAALPGLVRWDQVYDYDLGSHLLAGSYPDVATVNTAKSSNAASFGYNLLDGDDFSYIGANDVHIDEAGMESWIDLIH